MLARNTVEEGRAPLVPRRLVDLAALLAVYVVWGSTYYALRVGLEGWPPFLLAGVRFVIAGAILYAYLRVSGAPRPTAAGWWASARIGFFLLVCGNGAVTWAEQWVSSSLAALVVATMPLWAALFARAAGERPTGREWLGLALGFAGVAALNLGGELRAHGLSALGLAVAPLAWAWGSVRARRVPLPPGPMATAAEMLTGGVMMLGIALLRHEPIPTAPPARASWALAYLVVFGSLVAFSAYNHLLRHARPALATSYAYVNPLIALALGRLLGGERIAPLTWVAAAVIIGGVALITRARKT